jgi:hypothetical protein
MGCRGLGGRPSTHSCPNGAAHTSPGQRPGNQARHRPNPQTGASPSTKPVRLHPPNRCVSVPTIRVPDAYPPSVSRIHTHRPCPGCMPTVHVTNAYPPSHPQGCTLGWYALPLWGKWNAAERQLPTGRRNFETAPQTRMNACDARYHEVRGRSKTYTRQELNLRPTDSKSGALSN